MVHFSFKPRKLISILPPSIRKHQEIAIAALYLSSKLCESPVRLRDLLNIYTLLTSRNTHLLTSSTALDCEITRTSGKQCEGWRWEPPAFHDKVFYELKDGLVVAEIQILKRLGFNMQVGCLRDGRLISINTTTTEQTTSSITGGLAI